MEQMSRRQYEETSSSLEEMASMTRQNADNANKTDILMKESSVLISKGVRLCQCRWLLKGLKYPQVKQPILLKL